MLTETSLSNMFQLLSDNSNIFVILVLATIPFFFIQFQISWFLVWWVIFLLEPGHFRHYITRLRILLKPAGWSGFLSVRGKGECRLAAARWSWTSRFLTQPLLTPECGGSFLLLGRDGSLVHHVVSTETTVGVALWGNFLLSSGPSMVLPHVGSKPYALLLRRGAGMPGSSVVLTDTLGGPCSQPAEMQVPA